jgi:receptor protein-tyrosine kinase
LALKFGFVKRGDIEQALSIQFGYSSGETSPDLPSNLTAAVTPSAPFAEALRGLRSQLMMRWFDGTPGQSTLAVTSVDRGDGKSFVTANLGVVFSQLGERTLIIDGDLRHSTQHKLFGLRNRMGLSGILSGRAGFEEIAQIEHFPKLAVLPSGPQPPNPLELLGREEFALLLNELSSQYDVILIDTPSAQQAADAQVIAQRARGVLIVGRKDSTKSTELGQLASILAGSGATVLGTTLNEY